MESGIHPAQRYRPPKRGNMKCQDGRKRWWPVSWLSRAVLAGLLGSGLGLAVSTLVLSSWSGLRLVTMTDGQQKSTGWSPVYPISSANAAESRQSTRSGCADWSDESRSLSSYSSDLLTWRRSFATPMIYSGREWVWTGGMGSESR